MNKHKKWEGGGDNKKKKNKTEKRTKIIQQKNKRNRKMFGTESGHFHGVDH